VKTEVISFRKVIPKNTNTVIKERVKANGSVKEIRVRFFPGQQLALQVKPYILHKNFLTEDFFTYPSTTDGFLTGDDDYLVFPVTIEVELDDEIAVWANNTDVNWDYNLVVDMVIVYYQEDGL
jgi:hypothetical protein